MPKFRDGTKRQSCTIWKDHKPYKECAYLFENTYGDIGEDIWRCDRPDDRQCHPLYNLIGEEEANRRIKELDDFLISKGLKPLTGRI